MDITLLKTPESRQMIKPLLYNIYIIFEYFIRYSIIYLLINLFTYILIYYRTAVYMQSNANAMQVHNKKRVYEEGV